MGRHKKYTPKKLAEAVEKYFASISRIVTVTEEVATGERDEKGHKVYETKPVVNRLGEKVQVEEYIIPPTVGGLCAFLGIHRSTWAEYCDSQEHPEFSDTTTRARGRMREYLEQQLLTRKGSEVKGIIFDLQNNHGYTEKRQVELGPSAAKTVTAAALPMNEKLDLLKEIAMTYAEGGEADGPPAV